MFALALNGLLAPLLLLVLPQHDAY